MAAIFLGLNVLNCRNQIRTVQDISLHNKQH